MGKDVRLKISRAEKCFVLRGLKPCNEELKPGSYGVDR